MFRGVHAAECISEGDFTFVSQFERRYNARASRVQRALAVSRDPRYLEPPVRRYVICIRVTRYISSTVLSSRSHPRPVPAPIGNVNAIYFHRASLPFSRREFVRPTGRVSRIVVVVLVQQYPRIISTLYTPRSPHSVVIRRTARDSRTKPLNSSSLR